MKPDAQCNTGFEMPTSEIAAFHLHRSITLHRYNESLLRGGFRSKNCKDHRYRLKQNSWMIWLS